MLSSAEAKSTLCPALIRAYSVMDAVEGLDVDRDKFDKFHTRDIIARLLEELWRTDECVQSVAELRNDDLFSDFAGCVLGDLMYVLQDSLDRLTHIAEMEKAKADEATWSALPAKVREEKEHFTQSRERTAAGFLRNAKKTLQLLNLFGILTRGGSRVRVAEGGWKGSSRRGPLFRGVTWAQVRQPRSERSQEVRIRPQAARARHR